MPRNGSGQYNPLTNTWNPPVTGVLATGTDFQAQLNDISAAITQSVSKDGQTPMTANLPMNNNSIVGLATGTAASPSMSPINDTNTGLYFPAADTVAIATGGVKRVEVDASGNVGVEVTPSAWGSGIKSLQIGNYTALTNSQSGFTWLSNNAFFDTAWKYLTTNRALYYEQDTADGKHKWGNAASGTAGNAITFTQAMTLDASGRLLVNTSSYSYGYNATNSIQLDGALIIRTTTTTNESNAIVFNNPNGQVGYINTIGSSTTYATSSDYRLKENVQPMTGALAKVAQMKPCTYKWRVDGSDGQGFIAHELQAVIPDAVTGEKDAVDAEGNPQYQGIDTSFLVATLTAAIKEQQVLIDAQKTAIESLTARIAALEAK